MFYGRQLNGTMKEIVTKIAFIFKGLMLYFILQIKNLLWGRYSGKAKCNSRTSHSTLRSGEDSTIRFAGERNCDCKSDIDVCVIASTKDKRSLLTNLCCDTESDTPIDFLLYTPEEWEHSVADSQSFANKLNREGVVLYER